MKGIGIKILKELERSGELTLEEVSALLPKKHGDHRDYYVFASLVSSGMVDDDLLIKINSDPVKYKEQVLARKYFACSTAEHTAEFGVLSWHMPSGLLKEQVFALSGKGSLYLSELHGKWVERIFALCSGISIGIFVAFMSAYLDGFFEACS